MVPQRSGLLALPRELLAQQGEAVKDQLAARLDQTVHDFTSENTEVRKRVAELQAQLLERSTLVSDESTFSQPQRCPTAAFSSILIENV